MANGFGKVVLTKIRLGEAEAIRDWNLARGLRRLQCDEESRRCRRTQDRLSDLARLHRRTARIAATDGRRGVDTGDIVGKAYSSPTAACPAPGRSILHYPKEAVLPKSSRQSLYLRSPSHDRRIDRSYGYPVPYRCFYSRNIDNLFMAGRCISVTHEALGTTRVMKTCGMMGEVVGKPPSICVLHDCLPRDVYDRYWDEMDELLKLPGKARRPTVDDEIYIPADAMPLASSYGPTESGGRKGLDPRTLPGLIIDDVDAKQTGDWIAGAGLAGFVAESYLYNKGEGSIRFEFTAPASGDHEIRLSYQPHDNRGNQVLVMVDQNGESKPLRVNMKLEPPLENGFISLGRFYFVADEPVAVTLLTTDAGGLVHADAIQVIPAK